MTGIDLVQSHSDWITAVPRRLDLKYRDRFCRLRLIQRFPRDTRHRTGRAHRQNADRHRAGTRAPLPPGTYSVGPVEALGPHDPAELGPVWIGLEPRFPTGRGHLGIHLDPSANLNANSGTLGCVGLIRSDEMLELASLIEQRKVRKLVVME